MKILNFKNQIIYLKNRLKTVLFSNLILIVLFFSQSAYANNITCQQYCDESIRQMSYAKCPYDSKTCKNKITETKEWCDKVCRKDDSSEFTINCIEKIALGYAKKLWGKNIKLYDMQKYKGPNDKTLSHVFIFSTTNNMPKKTTLLDSSKYDLKENYWDDYFKGLEIGSTPGMPPIISYWDGVPAEYYFYTDAVKILKKKYGNRTYTLNGRYLSGVFPILSFKDYGSTYYFDIKSKKVTKKMKLEYNKEILSSPEYRKRIEKNKIQWVNHLGDVKEVCNGI